MDAGPARAAAAPGTGSRSIRTRLTVAFGATAVISVALAALVAVGLFRLASERVARDELAAQARTLARESAVLSRDAETALRVFRVAARLTGAAVYRVAPAGRLVLAAGQTPDDVPVETLDVGRLEAGQALTGTVSAAGGGVLYVAQPVTAGRVQAVIVLSRQASGGRGLLGPLAGRLLVAAFVAVGVGVGLAAYLARRIARPLRDLAGAASGVARGRFDLRVPVTSDDEIGVVASSFNRMAEELGRADRKQREFFLSVSHELRTPLTTIQGYGEAIEDGTIEPGRQPEAAAVIVRESRRLARLVADVLDLARIDARRFQISPTDVPVEAVLRSVQQAFAPKAAEAGVEIAVHCQPPAGVAVQADRDRLVQVLSNLVENALRYTPAGRRISLEGGRRDDSVEIRVTDGGLGLEPGDEEHAFDRQYLWGKYRGVRDVGTGLGLAITRELVEAMGGSVRAGNAPGGGAQFTIRLPAVA
jgi:two-component system sensor histidine kinase BaeS